MADSKRFRRAVEYLAARTLIFLLSLLPMRATGWVGRRLGDLLRLLDRRHRQRAYDQIKDRLGLEGAEADRFVKKNFRQYGMTAAEFAQLAKLGRDDILRRVDLNGLDRAASALLAEGRGLMLVTVHYGNWEWCNTIMACIGCEGGSIARPLDNPRVNELVRAIRERNGMRILDKEGAIRKAFAILKRKGTIGVLPDQDAGSNGMMSPFLGRPASTLTVPIELAMRTGSPILPMIARRNPPGADKHFIMVHRPVIRPTPDTGEREDVKRLVDLLNDELCALIMEEPEQWMWIHRRWKNVGKR